MRRILLLNLSLMLMVVWNQRSDICVNCVVYIHEPPITVVCKTLAKLASFISVTT
jgi:hypothetical protein